MRLTLIAHTVTCHRQEHRLSQLQERMVFAAQLDMSLVEKQLQAARRRCMDTPATDDYC